MTTDDASLNIPKEVHSSKAPEIRGLLGSHGDSPAWLEAVSGFPNQVPRFSSQAQAVAFMQEYIQNHGGSNIDHPHLQHIFTLIVGWEQIESLLLPQIQKIRSEPGKEAAANLQPRPEENIYESPECAPVVEAIEQRLDVAFHRCTTVASTFNTLRYLYEHMKFGIFVMIRRGELRLFAPFVNTEYKNTWSHALTIEGDGTLDSYYTQKSGLYREEKIEPDLSKWWANGNIICNERGDANDEATQHWGDHFLAPLRDMLAEACRCRDLPDCEFFLNKRDYPQLKVGRDQRPVEPYGFIFDRDDRDPDADVPLCPEHTFTSYAPIVSFYAAAPDRFTDLPFPSSEDWEAACGDVFPHSFLHTRAAGAVQLNGNPRDLFTQENFQKFARGWSDSGRVATAFFRGTATGGGTSAATNPRLQVAALSHQWQLRDQGKEEEPLLDAAIVGWNLRDKKTADGPMTFLRPNNFPFTAGRHHFTPIYEQSKYKYLVYVDGHCAACRYGFMMRLGSVILKVESRQVADRMWYFPLLKPYHDHVPVKADLSDLEEKIRWCREHDDECRIIGENAQRFYEKYVGHKATLDYIEMLCKQMAKRFVPPPDWWTPPPHLQRPPQLRKPDGPCFEERGGQSRLCVRCREDAEAEEQELERAQAQKVHAKEDAATRKKRRRERMIQKARGGKET